MSGCECKAGFFALRPCELPVIGRCPQCKRARCRRHSAETTGDSLCLDCTARTEQQSTRSTRPRSTANRDDDDFTSDRWVHGYRHDYYAKGYVPASAAIVAGSHYDEHDRQAFEQIEAEGGFDVEAGDAGFGDS